MKRIAITGGIGSGKSYVCQVLKRHGISVYDCDDAAKRLMATDEQLQSSLKTLVGKQVYEGPVLQKRVLAQFILASEANKQAVDNVVHPAVAQDFIQSGYEWLESAILFDSGFYKRVDFDAIVCVTAPLDVRVERIMKRDGITKEKALQWINSQWPQEKVAGQSDFVIDNDGKIEIEAQVARVLEAIYHHIRQ